MNDGDLADRILAILRRYRVYQHNGASQYQTGRKYAVWAGDNGRRGDQVIEPTSHADAQLAREGLIMSDLLDLMKGEKP